GVGLPAALLTTLLAEHAAATAVPATLLKATLQAGLPTVAGTTAAASFSAAATALAQRVLHSMVVAKVKMVAGVGLLLAGLLAAGMAVRGELEMPAPARDQAAVVPPDGKDAVRKVGEAPPDRHGDPLPPYALARLGTLRLRHGGQVFAVAYSPDGTLLASPGRDFVIRLGEAGTRKELRQLAGHTNAIMAIAFSSGGKRLASAGHDHSVRLWDVATGKVIALFQGHERTVTSVVFGGPGLISSDLDGCIRFWEMPAERGTIAGKEVQQRRVPSAVHGL